MFGISRVVKRIEEEKSLDQISEPVSKVVSKLTDPDAIKYLLSGSWLGHQLHPMLTDLPIGAWMMASTLDMTGGKKNAAGESTARSAGDIVLHSNRNDRSLRLGGLLR